MEYAAGEYRISVPQFLPHPINIWNEQTSASPVESMSSCLPDALEAIDLSAAAHPFTEQLSDRPISQEIDSLIDRKKRADIMPRGHEVKINARLLL